MSENIRTIGKATRFKKGQSGNPRGRPRQLVTALLREIAPEQLRRMVDVALAQAIAGDHIARAWITDRLEGKAVAREEVGEPGDFDNRLKIVISRVPDRKTRPGTEPAG